MRDQIHIAGAIACGGGFLLLFALSFHWGLAAIHCGRADRLLASLLAAAGCVLLGVMFPRKRTHWGVAKLSPRRAAALNELL